MEDEIQRRDIVVVNTVEKRGKRQTAEGEREEILKVYFRALTEDGTNTRWDSVHCSWRVEFPETKGSHSHRVEGLKYLDTVKVFSQTDYTKGLQSYYRKT